VLLSPLPSADALVLAVDGVLVLAPPGLVAAAAGRHGGAQRGGQLGGVGILQVHHMDVAAGMRCCRARAAGRAFDQRTHLATRAGLAARSIRALLRGSASRVVLKRRCRSDPAAAAGRAVAAPSISRATSGSQVGRQWRA
jgi:hypothetical protein